MNIANGSFSIKCDDCETQMDFPAEESDFDCVGGGERQMGNENLYEWESGYECTGCGKNINFTYTATEYPEGMPNFDSIVINGGEAVNKYNFNYSDGPETHEDENN